jgi:hypothetical protein
MIYAIGCSFTYGAELADRSQAWPSVIQELLGKEITNLGKEASGNTRIVKRALDAVLSDCELLIICWTNPGRIELADNYGVYDVWGGRVSPWINNTDLKHRVDLIKYTAVHDQPEYYYTNWLRQIILIQSICKLKKIPCVMFISHNANKLHIKFSQHHLCLVKNIDMDMFVDKTMFDSTDEWTNKLSKMPNGHPSPEGHKLIANKVYEHIRYISG